MLHEIDIHIGQTLVVKAGTCLSVHFNQIYRKCWPNGPRNRWLHFDWGSFDGPNSIGFTFILNIWCFQGWCCICPHLPMNRMTTIVNVSVWMFLIVIQLWQWALRSLLFQKANKFHTLHRDTPNPSCLAGFLSIVTHSFTQTNCKKTLIQIPPGCRAHLPKTPNCVIF